MSSTTIRKQVDVGKEDILNAPLFIVSLTRSLNNRNSSAVNILIQMNEYFTLLSQKHRSQLDNNNVTWNISSLQLLFTPDVCYIFSTFFVSIYEQKVSAILLPDVECKLYCGFKVKINFMAYISTLFRL